MQRHRRIAGGAKTRPHTAELDDHGSYESGNAENVDVQRALATLTLPLRTVVILHFYSGLNSYEIARARRIPAPTVRFRLAVAKRRLRPLLEVRLPSSSSASVTEVVS